MHATGCINMELYLLCLNALQCIQSKKKRYFPEPSKNVLRGV